ncbi:acylphosphatase [bacterium]|nr:acylphosphatase [bacterium]
MSDTLFRLRLLIRGRVQGVGFRWFVFHEARRLGLGGYVRNRGDGGVEVEAEGPEDALNSLEDVCRGGPPAASVERLERLERAPLSGAPDTAFEIR